MVEQQNPNSARLGSAHTCPGHDNFSGPHFWWSTVIQLNTWEWCIRGHQSLGLINWDKSDSTLKGELKKLKSINYADFYLRYQVFESCRAYKTWVS